MLKPYSQQRPKGITKYSPFLGPGPNASDTCGKFWNGRDAMQPHSLLQTPSQQVGFNPSFPWEKGYVTNRSRTFPAEASATWEPRSKIRIENWPWCMIGDSETYSMIQDPGWMAFPSPKSGAAPKVQSWIWDPWLVPLQPETLGMYPFSQVTNHSHKDLRWLGVLFPRLLPSGKLT
jgi:hypothetical protein